MLSVKQISEKFNLTPHAIRYYTDKGLIPTVLRDKNNNRVFDEDSFEWITTIIHLKKCGMAIDDIKKYVDLCLIGDSTLEERYTFLLKYRDYSLKQLEEAKEQADFMENKIQQYSKWISDKK